MRSAMLVLAALAPDRRPQAGEWAGKAGKCTHPLFRPLFRPMWLPEAHPEINEGPGWQPWDPIRIPGVLEEGAAFGIDDATDHLRIAGDVDNPGGGVGCRTGFYFESRSDPEDVVIELRQTSDNVSLRIRAVSFDSIASEFRVAGAGHAGCVQGSIQCHYDTYDLDVGDPHAWEGDPDGPEISYATELDVLSLFPETEYDGAATDVSDAGEYVGWAKDYLDLDEVCVDRAVYWEDSGADPWNLHEAADWQTGVPMPADQESVAHGISPDGQRIVGENKSLNRALLWERDGAQWVVRDLFQEIYDQTLPSGHTWVLQKAFDVNDDGWIVGDGEHDDHDRAFLLVPIGPCPEDLDDTGVVDVFDLLILLGDWGECPVGSICFSDLNADTVVDVFDLLQMLGAWGECGTGGGSIPQTVQDCIDKFGLDDPIALEACIEAVSGGLPE